MEHTIFLIGREVGELQQRVSRLEALAALVRHWGRRAALLAALWVAAIVGNLSSEEAGRLAASLIKTWIGQ